MRWYDWLFLIIAIQAATHPVQRPTLDANGNQSKAIMRYLL
jgi:hypothetical protein